MSEHDVTTPTNQINRVCQECGTTFKTWGYFLGRVLCNKCLPPSGPKPCSHCGGSGMEKEARP